MTQIRKNDLKFSGSRPKNGSVKLKILSNSENRSWFDLFFGYSCRVIFRLQVKFSGYDPQILIEFRINFRLD